MSKLKSLARWLDLNSNYFLLRRHPIVVYSMRRTGSVAVHKSLERDGHFTLAAHSFNLAYRNIPGELAGTGRWGAKHLFAKRKPTKIISLVRNPADNIISIFSRKSLGTRRNVPLETIKPSEELTADNLAVEFQQVHLKQKRHLKEMEWFDNEIKPVLGIDVYQYPFDHEQGFCQIKQGPYELLLLRTEIPSDRKQKLIAEFIGSSSFKLITSAEATEGAEEGAVGTPGEQAQYGELYKALKKSLRLPAADWAQLSQSQYMQHFCSPTEIATTAERYAEPA